MNSDSGAIAPCRVQTNAATATARRWHSSIGSPCMSEAANVAVNASPAPTVSATSTRGVARYDVRPSAAVTRLPLPPSVKTT